jgi:hypothetical protein
MLNAGEGIMPNSYSRRKEKKRKERKKRGKKRTLVMKIQELKSK